MEIQLISQEKGDETVLVKLDPADYEKKRNFILQLFALHTNIPGFRPGKAPLETVAKTISTEKLNSAILEEFGSTILKEVHEKSKHKVLGLSEITIEKDSPLKLKIVYAIKPKIKIDKIDELKVKAPKLKVNKQEVEDEVKKLVQNYADYINTDKQQPEYNDLIEITMHAYDEDSNSLKEFNAEKKQLLLVEGGDLPELDKKLTELKLEETSKFKIKLKKDFHLKQYASKTVIFEVTLHEIKTPVSLEVNEELSQKVFRTKLSKDEFVKEVEHKLLHKKIHAAEREQEEEFIAKILKHADFELSERLIKLFEQDVKRELEEQLKQYQVTPETYYATLSLQDKEEHNKRNFKVATERAQLEELFYYLIEKLNLFMTEEDLKAELTRLEHLKNSPHTIKKYEYLVSTREGQAQVKRTIEVNKLYSHFIEKIEHNCD